MSGQRAKIEVEEGDLRRRRLLAAFVDAMGGERERLAHPGWCGYSFDGDDDADAAVETLRSLGYYVAKRPGWAYRGGKL